MTESEFVLWYVNKHYLFTGSKFKYKYILDEKSISFAILYRNINDSIAIDKVDEHFYIPTFEITEENVIKILVGNKSDLENNLLFVKGSVPGAKNAVVEINKAVKERNKRTMKDTIQAFKDDIAEGLKEKSNKKEKSAETNKKDAKVVNAILRNMDLTPNQVTSEIKIGILEDVQALGVSSAMDIYNDPAKKFTEEYAYGKTTGNTNQVAAPAQYPIGTDANATISKGNSETNTMLSEASTDLSFNVDEADKEEEKDVDTQTDLAFPEVETKEVKKYVDVEVEIPLSERTNLAIKTVEERKRIQAGLNPDNPKDAAYIKLIDAQNSISNTPVLSEYMKDISSLNDVIGRQNQLDADPNVPDEEKNTTRKGSIAYNLQNAANDYIEASADKAKKEKK